MKEKDRFLVVCGFFILVSIIIFLICDITKVRSTLYVREITSAFEIADPYTETEENAENTVQPVEISSQRGDKTKVNINTADAEELTALPGIGEKISERIIEYRTENGLFYSIEEIMEVDGIGEAKFEAIKDMICV